MLATTAFLPYKKGKHTQKLRNQFSTYAIKAKSAKQ